MIIELSEDARLNLASAPYDTEGLTVVLLGNKGSGKSNAMAVMAEEAYHNQIPFIYYDPNGDAISLQELGADVLTIGNPAHPETIRQAKYPLHVALNEAPDFMRMVLKDGYSLVLDMIEQDDPHPLEVFIALVNEHYRMAGQIREPVFMFVDEAHVFAPQTGASDLEKLSRRALGKVTADGRKRGMLLVAATQNATYLDKRVVRGANVRIFGKVTYFPDYKVIEEYIGNISFKQMQLLRSGEVYIVSEKAFGKTRIKLRATTDLGKTPAFRKKVWSRPSPNQLELPIR